MTSPHVQPEYGCRVRQHREEMNLSLAELAADVRISAGYLRNIEQGHDGVPSRRRQIALASALDCPELGPPDAAYPTEPPRQPPREPTHPPKRQDTEQERKGPKRIEDRAAVAL